MDQMQLTDDGSSRGRPPIGAGCLGRGRATGFVSAVRLVVLLATTGWPAEARQLLEGDRVACCDAQRVASVHRSVERREQQRRPAHAAIAAPLPRVPHRMRRIDCGGLPPPRAPTS